MRKILFLLFVAASASLFSSCDEEIYCTEEYVMVTIQVTDQNGNPVIFDEYFTVRSKTGAKITTNGGSNPEEGIYLVIGDNFNPNLNEKTETFIFFGRKGSASLQEEFTITGDRCHIKKDSGPEKAIMEL